MAELDSYTVRVVGDGSDFPMGFAMRFKQRHTVRP